VQGQWAAVQDPWEVSQDVSLRANGHIAPVTDADGSQRELVANPMQFDERPAALRRAPESGPTPRGRPGGGEPGPRRGFRQHGLEIDGVSRVSKVRHDCGVEQGVV
jgi:hypothetical protein